MSAGRDRPAHVGGEPDSRLQHLLPEGACDCHVHVIGDPGQHPMLASRPYTPAIAPLSALRSHLTGLGLQRAVIVQPSFYGHDNRCMLEALAAMAGRARGVAVLDEGLSDQALRTLDAQGMRGVRLNIESSHGGQAPDLEAMIMPWVERLAPLGWHVQIYAQLPVLASCAALPRLPVPLVFDHFAMRPATIGSSSDDWQAVRAMLRDGRGWVKLSAPYRLPGGDAHHALAAARGLLEANPEQVLWGSDWPHTQREPGRERLQTSAFRAVPQGDLLRGLLQWLDSDARLQQVLVDNPARLYRF